jgi:hypothetical protein
MPKHERGEVEYDWLVRALIKEVRCATNQG